MAGRNEPKPLEDLLSELSEAGEDSAEAVSVADIMDRVGQRSLGPLLLVPALIAFSPLGGIPVLPTVLAAVVVLLAGQLLFGVKGLWLPQFVRKRSVSRERLDKSVKYLRPVARWIDKVLRPRLAWLTQEPFIRVAAGLCILVALTIPPLEVVPFGGSPSWAAIAAFGLALIAHDGALALVAFAFSIGAGYVVATTLM